MQLAETLGIAAEDVQPQVADTDTVGYTDVTGGSRVTFATGLAAYQLGLDIQEQMMRAGRARSGSASRPTSSAKAAFIARNGKSLTFKELAAKLSHTGGPVVGRASVDPEGPTNGFGMHIADVEVDPDTGKVTILRYTAVQDAGKAIHPSYVEGQMQGGAVQGIGWASTKNTSSTPRPDAERQLPRLPHAHRARRADDRDDHRRGAQPVASLRRARRRRDADRRPAGRDRQRRSTGHRRPDARTADVAAEVVGGDGQRHQRDGK